MSASSQSRDMLSANWCTIRALMRACLALRKLATCWHCKTDAQKKAGEKGLSITADAGEGLGFFCLDGSLRLRCRRSVVCAGAVTWVFDGDAGFVCMPTLPRSLRSHSCARPWSRSTATTRALPSASRPVLLGHAHTSVRALLPLDQHSGSPAAPLPPHLLQYRFLQPGLRRLSEKASARAPSRPHLTLPRLSSSRCASSAKTTRPLHSAYSLPSPPRSASAASARNGAQLRHGQRA